jgi:hypothetical protein
MRLSSGELIILNPAVQQWILCYRLEQNWELETMVDRGAVGGSDYISLISTISHVNCRIWDHLLGFARFL